MNKYQEAQDVINKMAEVKMQMNAHKGNIEDMEPGDICVAISDEVSELAAAFDDQNLLNIIEEAADVQNFLLAAVQQAINAYRGRK